MRCGPLSLGGLLCWWLPMSQPEVCPSVRYLGHIFTSQSACGSGTKGRGGGRELGRACFCVKIGRTFGPYFPPFFMDCVECLHIFVAYFDPKNSVVCAEIFFPCSCVHIFTLFSKIKPEHDPATFYP